MNSIRRTLLTREKHARPRRRRGMAYVLVLSITLLVTVLGLGALLSARISGRAAAAGDDWNEGGVLAFSATEHAISYINAAATTSPSGWRSAFTNNQVAFQQSMGRGTFN